MERERERLDVVLERGCVCHIVSTDISWKWNWRRWNGHIVERERERDWTWCWREGVFVTLLA